MYDLEELHSQFAEGLYPEEGWTHWDVRELLQALLHERREDLHNNVAERSILGFWHDLVQWINDVLPYGDWTGVAIEGALPDFARQLLLSEAAGYQPVGPKSVTDAAARWLGKLAIVALSDEWQWSRKDIYRFFLTLVDEFNERYSFG